jgi:predicted TIM-barrel fold metal-dependent hydrolase
VYADHLLEPWADALLSTLPAVRPFDVHTHVGAHDPSGFRATVPDLLDALDRVKARAVVFPLTEPAGYREANDGVLAAAARHERLSAFARLRPDDDPVAESRRCAGAGVAGFKLHPASDGFSLFDDRLDAVFALAERERLPVLVHAGAGVEPFGPRLLTLLTRFPRLRLILAHAALTDLAWLAERAAEFPALFFDTSWWSATDLLTLFARVPPGQILFASDLPYSTPVWAVHATLRCGSYAGLSPEQLAGVLGEQGQRLIDRSELLDLGPAPGGLPPLDPVLERVHVYLAAAVEASKRGDGPGQMPELTRAACGVAPGHPAQELLTSVLALLDRYDQHVAHLDTGNQYAPGWDLIAAAAVVARTPGPVLPVLGG